MKQYRPDTTCIHAGYTPGNGEPRVLPIVQSTTYTYDSSKEMGDLFDLKADGFFYTRLGNPTLDAVEKKLAALEGGVGALVTSSGQAATMMAVLNICHAGGHVVCSSAVYGGTFNLFYKTLHEMGIDCTFVSPNCTEDELNAAFRENTRCVFAETLTNPSLVVTDLEMFANAAHAHGVPCIVDNTFPTPINCRPFEFGVDIVTHSTTKYLDGHAVQLGGAIVDSGNFDWNNGKFPEFTEPDESYHGIVYAEHFGKAAYIAKARCHLMRDIGAQAAPMNAFYLNLGMETLALRMERHCSNAQKIAEFLEQDDRVAWVNYPGLERQPVPRARYEIYAARHLRRHFLRHQGRQGSGHPLYGQLGACLRRHARRRPAHLRAAPGQHHAPPDDRRAIKGSRRLPGSYPPLRRHRKPGRHPR